jgi:hypothetical protein
MYRNRVLRTLLVLLLMFSFALSVPVASGQRRRYRNPEAGKKKAAKRIGIGTAIGAGAGALIGGRKGALSITTTRSANGGIVIVDIKALSNYLASKRHKRLKEIFTFVPFVATESDPCQRRQLMPRCRMSLRNHEGEHATHVRIAEYCILLDADDRRLCRQRTGAG